MLFQFVGTKDKDTKRKRGQLLSSTLSEVSPNTMQPYPSKSPRLGREHPSFLLLVAFLILAKFLKARFKADASSYMSNLCGYLLIGGNMLVIIDILFVIIVTIGGKDIYMDFCFKDFIYQSMLLCDLS